MKRFAFAALLVVIAIVGAAARGEAAGSLTWTLQKTPTPNATTGGGELAGVSCPSTTDCVAVGYDLATPLSEVWNGTKWSVRPMGVPTGALDAVMQGVSCPSTSMSGCTAVGSDTEEGTGNEGTVVERWTGGHWVVEATPPTTGGTNGSATLLAVDCLKAADCVAVGTDGFANSGQSATLVEQWNGKAWSVVPSPTPSGFMWSVLDGVSCSSSTACIAVGYSQPSSGGSNFMLAEGWNGSVWTMLSPPEPAGATQSSLTSVSCAPAAGCVAVGAGTIAGTTIQSIAEGWDGSQWTLEPMPSLDAPELNGVSCPAAGDCTAVGSVGTSGDTGEPLAEAWNGTAWTVESTPSPTGRTEAWLWAASCVSTVSCDAVGFSLDKSGHWHTLAEGATT
jgi:hypothetical protein